MQCDRAQLLLNLAADNELAATEQEQLTEHLADCLNCRREAAWLETMAECFSTVEPMPEGLAEAVFESLADEAARNPQLPQLKPLEEEMSLPAAAPRRRKKPAKWLRAVNWVARGPKKRKKGWISQTVGASVAGFVSVGLEMQPMLRGSSRAVDWIPTIFQSMR